MRTRAAVGVGAWITGAATATGLSLLAVSFLGPDTTSAQGEALSPSEVSQALAAATATGAPGQNAAGTPSIDAQPTTAGSDRPSGSPLPDGPAATAVTSTPDPEDASAAQSAERLLTSPGGEVIARCQQGAAYLVSWSPAPGYQAGYAQRGPAPVASVVFLAGGQMLPLRVSCVNGVPTRVSGDDGRTDN